MGNKRKSSTTVTETEQTDIEEISLKKKKKKNKKTRQDSFEDECGSFNDISENQSILKSKKKKKKKFTESPSRSDEVSDSILKLENGDYRQDSFILQNVQNREKGNRKKKSKKKNEDKKQDSILKLENEVYRHDCIILQNIEKQEKDKKKKSKTKTSKDKEQEILAPKDVKVEPIISSNTSVENQFFPSENLIILLDRIEQNLPSNDKLMFSSRVNKLNWNQVAFNGYTAQQCKEQWIHIQGRIRRFRIMSEMIPEARAWIKHPWTNFYKSRVSNRHPDMPKKPLSMFMIFYNEMRPKVKKENKEMSMEEITKLCTERYKKMSDEERKDYMDRSIKLRNEYDVKMKEFYEKFPEQKTAISTNKSSTGNLLNGIDQQSSESLLVEKSPIKTISTNQNKSSGHADNVPQKPPRPFEYYMKMSLEKAKNKDPENFDQKTTAIILRKEWKSMKTKRKVKWIRKIAEQFRQYESAMMDYSRENPSFVLPSNMYFACNCLTQEDQKCLDKYMGRPEKPPSSSYALFSKEMLNDESIKSFATKERMGEISKRWKVLPQSLKDRYQEDVNSSMSVYRLKYENWFNELSEEERVAESARVSTARNKKVTKTVQSTKKVENPPIAKILEMEPAEPPKTAMDLFGLTKASFNSKSDLKKAWHALRKCERREWKDRLEELNQTFMKRFTEFVSSLNKIELATYSEFKKKRDNGGYNQDSTELVQNSENETSSSNGTSDSSDTT